MKQSHHRCLALTVSLLLTGALSPIANAQVTVPNVFANGKVADANEVNENFKALADGINGVSAGAKGDKGEKGADGTPGATGPAGPPGAACSVGTCSASSLATLSCGDTSVQIPCDKGYKTVFVTSQTYQGDLGGLAGADAKCNALASVAGLDGTYKAWLSDATGSPSTRFRRSSVPYTLVDGVVIANDWDDLVDGTLLSPINVTDKGDVLVFRDPAETRFPHTNTDANGRLLILYNPVIYTHTKPCNNWTSNAGGDAFFDVSIGDSLQTDSQWTALGALTTCLSYGPLICFEQ